MDYSIYTELRAKGFISVGHDEYWTPQMYDNAIKAAVECMESQSFIYVVRCRVSFVG